MRRVIIRYMDNLGQPLGPLESWDWGVTLRAAKASGQVSGFPKNLYRILNLNRVFSKVSISPRAFQKPQPQPGEVEVEAETVLLDHTLIREDLQTTPDSLPLTPFEFHKTEDCLPLVIPQTR